MSKTTRDCVKVKHIRPTYKNFREWLEDPNNVYVGRHGRVFIGKKPKQVVFPYKGSVWRNPFPVGTTKKKFSLNKSLELYEKYLRNELLKTHDIEELRNKNLGCWCDPNNKCHVDILLKVLKEKATGLNNEMQIIEELCDLLNKNEMKKANLLFFKLSQDTKDTLLKLAIYSVKTKSGNINISNKIISLHP